MLCFHRMYEYNADGNRLRIPPAYTRIISETGHSPVLLSAENAPSAAVMLPTTDPAEIDLCREHYKSYGDVIEREFKTDPLGRINISGIFRENACLVICGKGKFFEIMTQEEYARQDAEVHAILEELANGDPHYDPLKDATAIPPPCQTNPSDRPAMPAGLAPPRIPFPRSVPATHAGRKNLPQRIPLSQTP